MQGVFDGSSNGDLIENRSNDDGNSSFCTSGDACNHLWQLIVNYMASLVSPKGNTPEARKAAYNNLCDNIKSQVAAHDDWKTIAGDGDPCLNILSHFPLPPGMGSGGETWPGSPGDTDKDNLDVFGIVASTGHEAWLDTRDAAGAVGLRREPARHHRRLPDDAAAVQRRAGERDPRAVLQLHPGQHRRRRPEHRRPV